MINNIHLTTNPLSNSITDLMNSSGQTIGRLAAKTVKILENIPSQMSNSHAVAFGVIVTANVAFATLGHCLAKVADYYIEKHPKELSDDEKIAKKFFLNVVVVGGSILIGNTILSNVTQFPLSYVATATITVATIVARLFIIGEATTSKELDDETSLESAGGVNEEKMQQKQEEIASLKTQLLSTQAEAQGKLTEIEDLQIQLAKAKEQIHTLLAKEEEQAGATQDTQATAVNADAALQEALANKESELAAAQEELKNLTETLHQRDTKISELNTELKNLKALQQRDAKKPSAKNK